MCANDGSASVGACPTVRVLRAATGSRPVHQMRVAFTTSDSGCTPTLNLYGESRSPHIVTPIPIRSFVTRGRQMTRRSFPFWGGHVVHVLAD